MNSLRAWVSKLPLWRRKKHAEQSEDINLKYGPDDVRPTANWDQGLELTLSSLVSETTTKASGRVQVLSVSHLRTELGDGWERYRQRVLIIAETTIGRMIGKGNIYIPQEEDTWLLLMPSLNEREAEQKADEIAAVLGEKLVGERFEEKEPPLPQTAKVDLSTALNSDGSLNTNAMKAAVKRARLSLAAKDVKRPVRVLLGGAGADTRSKSLGNAASFSQISLFPSLTLAYRPQWVADTESFSTLALRAFTDTGEPVFGPNAPHEVQSSLNDATIIDLAKAAFADFNNMTRKGLRATYVLPVPFAVMTRKLGAVFLRALAELPQRERLTFLRIELVNTMVSTQMDTLVNIREIFRGRVKDVAFLMDLSSLNDQILALDHVVLGAEIKAGAFSNENDLERSLSEFRKRSAARRCYVMGLRSRDHINLAIRAGIDEVSGIGLADDLRYLPDRTSVIFKQDVLHGIIPSF